MPVTVRCGRSLWLGLIILTRDIRPGWTWSFRPGIFVPAGPDHSEPGYSSRFRLQTNKHGIANNEETSPAASIARCRLSLWRAPDFFIRNETVLKVGKSDEESIGGCAGQRMQLLILRPRLPYLWHCCCSLFLCRCCYFICCCFHLCRRRCCAGTGNRLCTVYAAFSIAADMLKTTAANCKQTHSRVGRFIAGRDYEAENLHGMFVIQLISLLTTNRTITNPFLWAVINYRHPYKGPLFSRRPLSFQFATIHLTCFYININLVINKLKTKSNIGRITILNMSKLISRNG